MADVFKTRLVTSTQKVHIVQPRYRAHFPQSIPGAAGKSAYQLWLDDGNTGTLSDFFIWLGTNGFVTYVNSLSEYQSDQSAYDDGGLAIGDWYIAADGHDSAASGTLKRVQASGVTV